jgi:hypothetical protein
MQAAHGAGPAAGWALAAPLVPAKTAAAAASLTIGIERAYNGRLGMDTLPVGAPRERLG